MRDPGSGLETGALAWMESGFARSIFMVPAS